MNDHVGRTSVIIDKYEFLEELGSFIMIHDFQLCLFASSMDVVMRYSLA